MDENPDYILLSPTVDKTQWIVLWMTFNTANDEYTAKRASHPYPLPEARRVAQLWAAPGKLDVRGDSVPVYLHKLVEEAKNYTAETIFRGSADAYPCLEEVSGILDHYSPGAQIRVLPYLVATCIALQEQGVSPVEQQERVLLTHDDRITIFIQRVEACYRSVIAADSFKTLIKQAGGLS